MDKASDFESEDCEFESRRGLDHFKKKSLQVLSTYYEDQRKNYIYL